MTLIINNVFKSNMSKMLPFQHIINVKLINEIFYFFVVGVKSPEFSVYLQYISIWTSHNLNTQ